ncbi:MAG: hypothetical protein ABII07_02645 [Patescibacteria group bacterium]|nr:hypothetical protein [Patescibacteria group bacterium]
MNKTDNHPGLERWQGRLQSLLQDQKTQELMQLTGVISADKDEVRFGTYSLRDRSIQGIINMLNIRLGRCNQDSQEGKALESLRNYFNEILTD